MTAAADIKLAIVGDVETSASWRRIKTDEYPDDARNRRSAEALERAAMEIGELPDDDPRFVALESTFGDVEALGFYLEEARAIIGRHGFDVPGFTEWPPLPTGSDLLDKLAQVAGESRRRAAAA